MKCPITYTDLRKVNVGKVPVYVSDNVLKRHEKIDNLMEFVSYISFDG